MYRNTLQPQSLASNFLSLVTEYAIGLIMRDNMTHSLVIGSTHCHTPLQKFLTEGKNIVLLPDEVFYDDPLGTGAFATVYKAKIRSPGAADVSGCRLWAWLLLRE